MAHSLPLLPLLSLSSLLSLLSLLSLSSLPPTLAGYYKVDIPNQNWDTKEPYRAAKLGNSKWFYGSATYYDFTGGSSGACGYPWSVVNRVDFAAVPDPRWTNPLSGGVKPYGGASCGQCYEVKCINVPRWGQRVYCNPGNPSVQVIITDYDTPGSRPGGLPWPNNHFDLKPSAFAKIADKSAGEVNLKWRRVSCAKRQKCKWTLWSDSNPFWHNMVVYDVPGVGAFTQVYVRTQGRKKFSEASHTWGAHYQYLGKVRMDGTAEVWIKLAEGKGRIKCDYAPTS